MYKVDKHGYLDISDIEFPKGCPKISNLEPPKDYEIAISLFEKCNLRCKFCFQEHAKDVDIEFIKSIPEFIFNNTKEVLHKYTSLRLLKILMMGGELFADNISDEVFEQYDNMCAHIKELFTKEYPNLRIEFVVGTNGVWEKRDRVFSFFKKYNIGPCVSYDPVGRHPSERIAQIARDTIKQLHENGFKVTISSVLTKNNIKEVLTNPKYLSWLKSEYVSAVDLNWYIGNPGWEEDLPSDDDVANFCKWCIDNRLFKIKLVRLLFEGIVHKSRERLCDCKFLLGVGQGSCTRNCIEHYSSYENKFFYGDYSDELTEANVSDVKTSLGVVKRGCLTCEYYETCQMPCWCSVLFEKFIPSVCPLKQAFEYITEEHIRDFNKWSNK